MASGRKVVYSPDDLFRILKTFIQDGKVPKIADLIRDQGLPDKFEARAELIQFTAQYAKMSRITDNTRDSCHKIMRLLVAQGCNVDAPDVSGFTAMHWACKKGYVEMVDVLIELKANLNSSDRSGITPLHMCSSEQIMERLIMNGANVNVKNSHKETKLHLLASDPNEHSILMMNLLLGTRKLGVDEDSVQLDEYDEKGNTPRHILAFYIINNKENHNEKLEHAMTMLTGMLKGGASPDVQDGKKKTLRYYAVHDELVSIAVERSREGCRVCSSCVVQ